MTDQTPTGKLKREPVREWTHAGRECKVVIVRVGPAGHYCGYAKTTLEAHYDELQDDIDIHGGLTYGVDAEGWLGFDCAHAFDTCISNEGERLEGAIPGDPPPGLNPPIDDLPPSQVWTIDGVVAEVERLAEQLDALEDQND